MNKVADSKESEYAAEEESYKADTYKKCTDAVGKVSVEKRLNDLEPSKVVEMEPVGSKITTEYCIDIKDGEKGKEAAQNLSEEKDNVDVSTKFKSFKCKNIVSIEDKFNNTLEKDQMCKLCTMIQAYG